MKMETIRQSLEVLKHYLRNEGDKTRPLKDKFIADSMYENL